MKRSINKIFAIALPFLSSMAFSEEPMEEKAVPSYEQGHAIKESDIPSGYNATARINVNGAWDVFINGSYILWQPREEGLEFALQRDTTGTPSGRLYDMDFDFSSGFKVAFGTVLNHDNWVAVAEYTRLHTRNHRDVVLTNGASPENVEFWLWNTNNKTFGDLSEANAHWQIKYDVIDLAFGRPCYLGTHLVFKPHFGLRGGWIDQHYNIRYFTNTLAHPDFTAFSYNKSDSWMIGPRAGFGMNWLLGAGFRMLANGAGSLSFQKFKVRHSEEDENHVENYLSFEKLQQVTPNLECDTGFGWGTYFDNNNWHFDILASYHFEVYWNQNRMRALLDELCPTTQNILGKPGPLSFQGLTVTAQLDF